MRRDIAVPLLTIGSGLDMNVTHNAKFLKGPLDGAVRPFDARPYEGKEIIIPRGTSRYVALYVFIGREYLFQGYELLKDVLEKRSK